jgi:outer membrane protein assembly factor BamB
MKMHSENLDDACRRLPLAGGPRAPDWKRRASFFKEICSINGAAWHFRTGRVAVRLGRGSIVTLCALVLLTGAHSAVAADWPLVRGDALATGASSEAIQPPLDILWTYEAEGSGFEATPSIVGGVVYVGDVDGTFHAVKLADGESVWTRKFEETGFVAGSAVVDGRIYCVDFNGTVRCLQAENGETIWEFNTDTSLYAAPNVHDGIVLLAGDSGQLFALDAVTGEQRWEPFTIDQPLRCWPTVVNGQALIAGCDGRLHLVDVKTGVGGESIDIGGPADGMPAVVGDRVFFCTAGGVFHGMSISPLKSLWQFGHRGQGEEIHAAAAVEKAIVLGTHDKQVVALGPATGEVAWTAKLRSRAESSPVIAGDLVLFGTVRGRLQGLQLSDGKEVWNEEVGGRFTGSPALSNGRMVIGNEDGTLYCIGGK